MGISKVYYLAKYTHLVRVGYIIYLTLFSQNNTPNNKMHTQGYINLKKNMFHNLRYIFKIPILKAKYIFKLK